MLSLYLQETLLNGDLRKREITQTKNCKFFVQYRLAGTEIYKTKAVGWDEVAELEYNQGFMVPLVSSYTRDRVNSPDGSPDPSDWRDFFQLLGIDFLLYKQEHILTVTETELTEIYHPPSELTTPAGSLTTSRATSRSSSNPTPSSTREGGSKKKGKKNKEESKDVVTRSVGKEEETVDTCLGVFRFETKRFLAPR